MIEKFIAGGKEFTWNRETGDLSCGDEYISYAPTIKKAHKDADKYLFMKSYS